jgi:hypothetical protein
MKKIALVFVIFSLCLSQAKAQDTAETPVQQQSQKLRMGLSISPLIGWFTTDGDAGQVATDGIRFNIKYGLHIDTRLGANPNYYFSTGLFVMNTGGKLDHQYFRKDDSGNAQLTDRNISYRFNYVNIPLTMMLRTNEIGYMTYFARVGFDSGFNIKATADYDDRVVQTGEVINTTDDDASDFAGLFRAGLHLEGGIEYNFTGSSRFMLSIEWNNGLNNVFDGDYKLPVVNSDGQLMLDENGEVQTERRVKGANNNLMLNLGVYF